MKIGSNQQIFEDFGDNWFKKMKEYGFDYADLRIDCELDGRTEARYEEIILHQKALADEAGVTIWQVHGPWRYPPHDETPEHRAERLHAMSLSIRLTGKIGCKYWVVHPLMPFGADDDFDLDRFMDINYEHFQRLLPIAKENGVTICLENMPMKFLTISTPQKALEFVRRMNDDNFKFCLDTGHAAVFGIQAADAVRMAGDDLKVIHVHDNMGEYDQHLVPLTGIIDWKEFHKALCETGFDGVFSLELRGYDLLPHATTDTRLKAIRAIVDEITGY